MHAILAGHAVPLEVVGLHLEVAAHTKLSAAGPEIGHAADRGDSWHRFISFPAEWLRTTDLYVDHEGAQPTAVLAASAKSGNDPASNAGDRDMRTCGRPLVWCNSPSRARAGRAA